MAKSRPFDMGLTSAKGQKQECFKGQANDIFIILMKIQFRAIGFFRE